MTADSINSVNRASSINSADGALLEQLVWLSRALGRPERDLAILGEGNTSVRLDCYRFLVKASGTSLTEADGRSFVEMDLRRTLAILDLEDPSDAELADALMAARTDEESDLRPSIEAVMHALCLTEGGAAFAGHTHPVSVNSVLCSDRARALSDGAIFPDQVVVLGRHPLHVPYADVGLPLARAVRDGLRDHRLRAYTPPKTIYLQNHGLVALGQSAGGVDQVTQMADKHARIMAGALAAGEPVYLTPQQADRLDSRSDEEYRRWILQGRK